MWPAVKALSGGVSPPPDGGSSARRRLWRLRSYQHLMRFGYKLIAHLIRQLPGVDVVEPLFEAVAEAVLPAQIVVGSLIEAPLDRLLQSANQHLV